MCNLLTKSTEEKIEGFKIVAKKPKGKRYFSTAMGFQYPLDGHIPIVKKQCSITSDFIDNIISKTCTAYSDHMVGRTSVFLNYADAQEPCRRWDYYTKKEYKLVIVRCEVSIDVMEGTYMACVRECKVAAGRHINFIEELDH